MTRDGAPVTQRDPAAPRRGVARQRLVDAFRGVPVMALGRLRDDLDQVADPGVGDPWVPRR